MLLAMSCLVGRINRTLKNKEGSKSGKSDPMLKTFVALLWMCFAASAFAKLGETVPQLVKRFGKSYTVEESQLGKTYKFRSANVSVDAVVSDGRSICETYFSDHPLTASGEPPNDIVSRSSKDERAKSSVA